MRCSWYRKLMYTKRSTIRNFCLVVFLMVASLITIKWRESERIEQDGMQDVSGTNKLSNKIMDEYDEPAGNIGPGTPGLEKKKPTVDETADISTKSSNIPSSNKELEAKTSSEDTEGWVNSTEQGQTFWVKAPSSDPHFWMSSKDKTKLVTGKSTSGLSTIETSTRSSDTSKSYVKASSSESTEQDVKSPSSKATNKYKVQTTSSDTAKQDVKSPLSRETNKQNIQSPVNIDIFKRKKTPSLNVSKKKQDTPLPDKTLKALKTPSSDIHIDELNNDSLDLSKQLPETSSLNNKKLDVGSSSSIIPEQLVKKEFSGTHNVKVDTVYQKNTGNQLFRNRFLQWDKYNAPLIGKDTCTDAKAENYDAVKSALGSSLNNDDKSNVFSDLQKKIDKQRWDELKRSANFSKQLTPSGYKAEGNKDFILVERKYFIYRCDEDLACDDWAHQIAGAMFSYIVANLTGRIFKAKLIPPKCNMDNKYFLPNKVNWIFSHTNSTAALEKAGKSTMDQYMKQNTNFSKLFDQERKYIRFSSRKDNIPLLKKSTVYRKQLSWMQYLNNSDIYAGLYKRLFKLSPFLQFTLERFLSSQLLTSKHRLVCLHILMDSRLDMASLPNIWSFVANHSKSELDRVFVMSASQAVIASAKEQSFQRRLLAYPGQSSDGGCQRFQRFLLEYHTLMACDVLVRGHRGLGVLAANVRGSDHQLYCILKYGQIVPCARHEFLDFD